MITKSNNRSTTARTQKRRHTHTQKKYSKHSKKKKIRLLKAQVPLVSKDGNLNTKADIIGVDERGTPVVVEVKTGYEGVYTKHVTFMKHECSAIPESAYWIHMSGTQQNNTTQNTAATKQNK